MSFIIDKRELSSANNRKHIAESILRYIDEIAAAANTAEAIQIDMIPMEKKTYYNTKEVAEFFQVSDRMVRKWCENERIAALRTPGGAWRIQTSQFGDLTKVKEFQGTADRINERFLGYPDIDDFEK